MAGDELLKYFTDNARRAVACAGEHAAESGYGEVDPEHLFWALAGGAGLARQTSSGEITSKWVLEALLRDEKSFTRALFSELECLERIVNGIAWDGLAPPGKAGGLGAAG